MDLIHFFWSSELEKNILLISSTFLPSGKRTAQTPENNRWLNGDDQVPFGARTMFSRAFALSFWECRWLKQSIFEETIRQIGPWKINITPKHELLKRKNIFQTSISRCKNIWNQRLLQFSIAQQHKVLPSERVGMVRLNLPRCHSRKNGLQLKLATIWVNKLISINLIRKNQQSSCLKKRVLSNFFHH